MLAAMRIAVDMHVHLYPFHRLHTVFDSAHRNLRQAAPEADRFALCLAERAGQHAFDAMRRGELKPAVWRVGPAPEGGGLDLRAPDGSCLWLVPGRQLVTAERIEVLALGRDLALPDGQPLHDTIANVRAGGALPVLPWGFGKWLGARGRRVRAAIEGADPGSLAVADTYLRPRHAPPSPNLRLAASRGLAVLAGSDPLPQPGEEEVAGRYGVLVEGEPGGGLAPLLGDPRAVRRILGSRCTLGECLRRLR